MGYKMKFKKIIFIWVVSFTSIYSQQNPSWMHFNTDNSDLPSNTIQAIVVDSNDVKWIGTNNGLSRFDGINWHTFDTSNGLVNNNITALAVDNLNILWVIDSVLSSFDGTNWKHYQFPTQNGSPMYSRVLSVDSDNILWMLYTLQSSSDGYSNSIISFKDSVFTIYDYLTTGINFPRLNCLVTKGDEIWIGGYHKLFLYSSNTWKDCTFDSLSQSHVTPIISGIDIDEFGNKWIASHYEKGTIDQSWSEFHLYKLENTNKYYDINLPLNISDGEASSLMIDDKNNIWLGVHYLGLLKLTQDSIRVYNVDNSGILSHHIGNISVDKNDNKWLATAYDWYSQGVSVYREEGVILTSLKEFNNNITTQYSLSQNYPNPFNPSTTISYSLPQSGWVQLKVYDLLGREVSSLVNEEQSLGNYKVEFNANNFTSGIYFYKLQSGSFTETKKLILLR